MRPTSHRIFISYKSENANEVRSIVEGLLASGVSVWFAEYEVLAASYDAFQQNVDQAILSAIDGCDAAVVFTNNRWAGSRYCLDEIRHIVATIPHQRILQVCIPKENQPQVAVPVLADVPSIEYRDAEQETVFEFIRGHLGFASADALVSVHTGEKYLTRFGPVRTGPLRRVPLPPSYDRVARTHLFRFQGSFDTQRVSLDLNVNPHQTSLSNLPLTLRGLAGLELSDSPASTDDRQIYSILRHRARNWYAEREIVERGLHLFFVRHRGQMALTFSTTDSDGCTIWHRTYAVLILDPVTGGVGEADMEFMVPFSRRDTDGTFVQFCRILPRLDAIAASFEYRGDLVEVRRPSPVVSFLMYVVGASVAWVALRMLVPSATAASTQLLALVAGAYLFGGRLRDWATKLSLKREKGEEHCEAWDPNEIKTGRYHESTPA